MGSKMDRTIVSWVLFIMVIYSISAISTGITADDGRGPSIRLPEWEVGNKWKYIEDEMDPQEYHVVSVYMSTGNGDLTLSLTNIPYEMETQREYTVDMVNDASNEYKLMLELEHWENGSWEMRVIESTDPDYGYGDVVYSGVYSKTGVSDQQQYLEMSHLGFKRGTGYSESQTDYEGDLLINWYIEETSTESTVGPEHMWYPDWEDTPMQVGDKWTDEMDLVYDFSSYFEASGDLQGDGNWDGYSEYWYDRWLECTDVMSKTVRGVVYPDAFRIKMGGDVDWITDYGSGQNSGSQTLDQTEKWVAKEAGWGIEYNFDDQLVWTNFVYFQNSPPLLDAPPSDPMDIYEDETWELINGVDYAVSDPDPGLAGELSFAISAELDGNTNILTDLTIDDNGDIAFTPCQEDVADGYEVTITVTDSYTEEPMEIEINFTLNVLNKNDPPIADPGIMSDFEMTEGETKAGSFKLSDVFTDPDMDLSPLTDIPYDHNERLVYSVSNNGSIRMLCNGQDMNASNQCDQPSFEAIDGQFPRDLPVAMTFKATDTYGESAFDQIVITVRHLNHPVIPADTNAILEFDEDTVVTIDLRDYFYDADIGDPHYPTQDELKYDIQDVKDIVIEIEGKNAKFVPERNWNGERIIVLKAKDTSGAKAEFDLKLVIRPVNDPPELISATPNIDPEFFEVTSSGPNSMDFSLTVNDVDSDVVWFDWYLETLDTGERFELIEKGKSSWTMDTTHDCDPADLKFCGGRGSRTYILKVNATDGDVEVELKTWLVKVKDVNRAPSVNGVGVYLLGEGGSKVLKAPDSPNHYKLGKGLVYRWDGAALVTDLDEGLVNGLPVNATENLTYSWSTDEKGVIGTGKTLDVATSSTVTGGQVILGTGVHDIVLKVSDGADGVAEYRFTITVKKGVDGRGSSSEIEATTAMPCGLVATLIVLVMATRVTHMILMDRRRADLRMARGVDIEKNDDVDVDEDG